MENESAMSKVLKIGTRSSPLALWQAEWVSGRIRERYPEIEVTLVENQDHRR